MADDFNVKFGSNARSFSTALINDLKPARAEITSFIRLLGDLDGASKQAIGNANRGAATLGAGGRTTDPVVAKGLDFSSVEDEMHSFQTELRNMVTNVSNIVTALGRAVPNLDLFVRKSGEANTGLNRSIGNGQVKMERGNDTRRGPGGHYSSDPTHKRDSERVSALLNPKALEAVMSRREQQPFAPTRVDFSGITKLQLDQAGFDRVVNKLEDIRRALDARPNAGVTAPIEPAASSTKGKKSKGSKKAVEESLEVTADEAEQLRKDLVKAQELVVKRFGGDAPPELKASIDSMRQRAAAMEAKTERSTTGVKQSDQKDRRRQDAEERRKKFADLDTAEYDARKRELKLIQDAGRADFAERAKKRGKGGISTETLVETAQAFQRHGFDVQYGSKTTKSQFAERIGSARSAFEAEHGTDIPDSLQVGTRPKGPVKISPELIRALGDVNRTAMEIAEENAAREVKRIAYLTGNLPPKPAEASNYGNSGVKLSDDPTTGPTTGRNRPITRGGQYYDAFGFNAASEMLDQRALGRAANLYSKDPTFNPFELKEKDHIEGSGDDAKAAKDAFRGLKRATRELDDLARQYDEFADAINDAERFIGHAEGRIKAVASGRTDGMSDEDIERARTADAADIERRRREADKARRAMASDRFKGLQDVFEDPAYQGGRRLRDATRERIAEEQANRPDRAPNVDDAYAAAIAERRTTVGSKAQFSPAPGLAPDGKGGFRFAGDAQYRQTESGEWKMRNPKELDKLNNAFRSYKSGLARESNLADDLRDGTEGITPDHLHAEVIKTENAATKFLNEVQRMFGAVQPRFHDLVGRPAVTPAGIEGEARRDQARADLNKRAASRPVKPTDVEKAVAAKKEVERTEKLLAKANEDLTKALEAEKAAVNKASTATNARPKAEREAIERRRAMEDRLAELDLKQSAADRFPGVETINKKVGKSSENVIARRGLLDTPREELSDDDIARISDYREYASQHAARKSQAVHELEDIPKIPLTPEEDAASDARRRAKAAKARQEGIEAGLARRKQTAVEAQENIGGKEPEAKTLQRRLSRSQNIRKELSDLRTRLKAAQAADDQDAVDALAKERDALKAKNAKHLLSRAESKALRSRISSLNAAAVTEAGGEGGSGGAGKPPTGGSGAAGAAGGRGGSQADLLRQILAKVTSIDSRIQTGVRTVGKATTAAEGAATPVTRAPKGGASIAELRLANSDDERERAKAAVQQQRRLEKLRLSGTLGQTVNAAHDQAAQENARITKSNERATRASTEADRAKARSAAQVQASLSNLNSSARTELETLRQLNRDGASNEKIVHQQARAYAAMNKALHDAGVQPGGERHKQIRDLLTSANVRVGKGGKETTVPVSGPETDQIRRSAANIGGFKIVDQAMAREVPPQGIFGEQSAFTKAMFGNAGFWSRVMNSTGTFVVRNFTAGFVFGLTNALQDVVHQAIITESTFIRVSDALEQTGRSSGTLRTQLQGISSAYGTNLEDVYATAAGLTGLFDDIDDIAGATKVVSELQAISMGALNAQEAMGSLASITGAYGDELGNGVDGLSQVADALTVVQNVIGTNVETTAEGVGAMSGLSKQLKIDFEDTATYVAQVAKLTNQTGAAAGEALSRIFASMQSGRGKAALNKALPGTGIDAQLNEGDYGGAIKTLLQNWDGLSNSQQNNLAVTIAGQRQMRSFMALMNDSNKVLDASARAHNAEGQAQQRASAIAKTLTGQIARLTSNLQNMAQNLIRTGILDFFGALLMAANGVLSGVNKLFSMFNDVADSSPILTFLKRLTAGLAGFLVAAKLSQLAIRGFKASLTEMRAGGGIVGAGINGAFGAPGGEKPATLRNAIANAPAGGASYLDRKAQDLRRPSNPTFYGPMPQGAVTPEGRAPTAKPSPVQGPMMANGAFYSAQAAQEEGKARRALAASASGTAKGLRGLGNTLDGVRNSSVAAQVGLGVLFAAIFAGIDGMMEHGDRAEKYRELYGGRYNEKTGEEKDEPNKYIGPWDDLKKENEKQTRGAWGWIKTTLNPKSIGHGLTDELWGSLTHPMDDDYRKENPTYNERLQGKLPTSVKKGLKGFDKDTRASIKDLDPNASVEDVQAESDRASKRIAGMRKKIDENTKLTEEQRTHALADLEELRLATEENLNKRLLLAKGIADKDVLSTTQITDVDTVKNLLMTTATSGGGVDTQNPRYADLLKKRIEDTGVRPGSDIDSDLQALANGRLNKGDALTKVQSIYDKLITQTQSRLAAAVGRGADDEEIRGLQSTLDQFVSQQAQILQEIIDAISASAESIAGVAAGRGNFGGAARTIRGARDRIAGMRDRASESPEIRAQRDSVSASQSERAAELETQGQTWKLERQKSRGTNAQQSARIDSETARIAYQNLAAERKAAQAAGAEGPTIQSLRQAKNTWLAAQRTSAMAAQDANIAQMTAAAAGLWNGVAAASAQEGIALQQYTNAKANFGANSTEALNALATYRGAQKSVVTTMDQVAESRRQAMIASIPQGNQLGVARAQVGAARAALDAARKYGQNSTEYQGALAQLYSAQQQATSAQGAVRVAQAQLSEAYATARGDSVGAARAAERTARVQLAVARQASGGARSAETIAARAQVIQARAATRDAILQDRLDTIDFNLQMGKTTQSSAIAAMKQILRTANLTKQQRRDLLLKIKGMKDEIVDGPWNFADVKLPTPYQMRRYVTEEREAARAGKIGGYSDSTVRASSSSSSMVDNSRTTVLINGADTAKVRKVLEDVLGNATKTRTSQGRRR